MIGNSTPTETDVGSVVPLKPGVMPELPPGHVLRRWFGGMCSCFSPAEHEAALHSPDTSDISVLPPEQLPEHEGRKTLVLDLDETLVHSVFRPIKNPDLQLNVDFQEGKSTVYVKVRPGVAQLLDTVCQLYEVVLFTASLPSYANPVIDSIDTTLQIPYRLFRDACVPYTSGHVKDLSRLGRNLKNVIIVDNSPTSFCFQPENAVHIQSWFDDKLDIELYKLAEMLENLAGVDDVRDSLPLYIQKYMVDNAGGFIAALPSPVVKEHEKDGVQEDESSLEDRSTQSFD